MANPVNLGVLAAARHSVGALEGLRQLWDRLAEQVDPLQVRSRILGAVFGASGRVAPDD